MSKAKRTPPVPILRVANRGQKYKPTGEECRDVYLVEHHEGACRLLLYHVNQPLHVVHDLVQHFYRWGVKIEEEEQCETETE